MNGENDLQIGSYITQHLFDKVVLVLVDGVWKSVNDLAKEEHDAA